MPLVYLLEDEVTIKEQKILENQDEWGTADTVLLFAIKMEIRICIHVINKIIPNLYIVNDYRRVK